MSAEIINGKQIAEDIKNELKDKVENMVSTKGQPTLAVVLVGEDQASQVYVRNKKRACEYVGIRSLSYELPEATTQEEILALVQELNEREDVHGILVQLPLPAHIDDDLVIMTIDPKKDVDGFHPINVGNLSIGHDGFVSCTPAGIIELMKRSQIEMSGKNCVIVGRSNIVGKPIAMLMIREHATVTVTHSRTKNLPEVCKQADILIVAIGRAKFVTKEFVKEGAVVIDVGINRDENGKLCGDVDFDDCVEVAGAITPVPKGVGPMTIAMLISNCVKAYEKN
ncbi:bifunctional methylenetetrahydrofolate dehydrogenase/methenyltetrahydrofolate cyclohydrolase FolD [Petrocella sp. FN5]|uniref:bifunctional methylenetetrahydrofolate dehydrogenase/methenyltetrahydrofolate cyclohydrolase FolD n=1 Tax=Petrocella sp. FN5 TaxID=3032002 RepID=UPI0023DCE8B5|nr:bifunctional methylenetetrahydrofolate dehydrogenase/methenyltetrahydrofolate cyclohydrolase FolD [Petrocella sp. FN5]MDF1616983.1 bifunctional methylenetetrahydrofolate dehydrogenase/methenyltetrahydrofolate cyclohydrolase FolD [Petrocella sp. FN5]